MNSLEENSNCLLAHATFRVLGQDLDPEAVSAALGVEPSQALRRDQLVPTETRIRRQDTGVWLLKTEGRLTSTSLERHVLHLLELIEPGMPALDRLRQEQGLTTDFFCFWLSATGHGGPIFSSELMGRVAAVGAELGIDFYGGVEDDGADLAPPPARANGLTIVRPPGEPPAA